MHDPIQWISLLGMVVIGVLFLIEVRKWRSMGSVMTRGQRVLRAFMFIAIEALFAMMIAGPLVTSHRDPLTSLLYWTLCLVTGLIVIVLVLLDCRAVVRNYVRVNRQMFGELRQPRVEHPELPGWDDDRPEK